MELPLIHIDQSQLCRAGFRHIVQNSHFNVGWDGPGWKDAAPVILSLKPVIIIADFSEQWDQFRHFHTWLSALSDMPKIVLFADGLPSSALIPLIPKVDGYIGKHLSAMAIVHALQLIHAGQKIFPPEIMNFLTNFNASDRYKSQGLSPRELQVLAFLRNGRSNKQIANDLALAENTVKAHVKGAMKKIQATNRTQAAMWAVANGVEGHTSDGLLP